jgi:hypothetical protein
MSIVCMEWPVCSPDCYPIEHSAGHIAQLGQQPCSLCELENALVVEWNAASQIQRLIRSMRQQCLRLWSLLGALTHTTEHEAAMSQAVIIARGSHTHHGAWGGDVRLWSLLGALTHTTEHEAAMSEAVIITRGSHTHHRAWGGNVRLWSLLGALTHTTEHEAAMSEAVIITRGSHTHHGAWGGDVRLWSLLGALTHAQLSQPLQSPVIRTGLGKNASFFLIKCAN